MFSGSPGVSCLTLSGVLRQRFLPQTRCIDMNDLFPIRRRAQLNGALQAALRRLCLMSGRSAETSAQRVVAQAACTWLQALMSAATPPPGLTAERVGLRGGNPRSGLRQLDTRAGAAPLHTPSLLHACANPTACAKHSRARRAESGPSQECVRSMCRIGACSQAPGR